MSLKDMDDHVFVLMVDLLGVRACLRTEGDETHAESFSLHTTLVTDLIVDLFQFSEGLPDLQYIHLYAWSVSISSLFYGLQDFFNGLISLGFGHPTGADDPVSPATKLLHQGAHIDPGGSVENVVSDRDRRSLDFLGVV